MNDKQIGTVARVGAAVGGVVALLTLYVVGWWSSDYLHSSFLGAAHELTASYADPTERQFTMTAATNVFFRWGHLVFAALVVLTALAVFRQLRRVGLVCAGLMIVAMGWMIYAVHNAGWINMRFTAYIPYLGALTVAAAAAAMART